MSAFESGVGVDGTPGSGRSARALIEAALEQKGGRSALVQVRAVRTRTTAATAGGPTEILIVFPDDLVVRYLDPQAVRQALCYRGSEQQATVLQAGRVRTLPASARDHLAAAMEMEPIRLLPAASEPSSTLTRAGGARVGDQAADAVDVVLGSGSTARLYIDQQTSDLIAYEYVAGDATVTVIESHFAPVDGLRIAHQTRVISAMSDSLSRVESVELNPSVPLDAFDLHAGASSALEH